MEQPVLQKKFYSSKPPRGYHTVKVWKSQKEEGKYNFSVNFGSGVMSKCEPHEEDSPYQFGQFKTPEDALLAGKLAVYD